MILPFSSSGTDSLSDNSRTTYTVNCWTLCFSSNNVNLVEEHLKEKYNLFNLFIENKEWNRNKIKIVRSFYDRFLADIEYPEIRT